ncbi:heterokaryon incompatibility protein-domain-containing protein [Neurospora tetraspora]|uniref:Heterokaryon incompatibility protein-domain-containing protein n=1 Tax=Neurospora tetraspora TaxID=94610 RepID=A0AAE0J9E6_9PEZI|nr:heterokaryon incompatibility protein-domain-containing protein [Neurospora tetraspora]
MDGKPLEESSSEDDGSTRQSKHILESSDMEPNRLCKRCSRALTASKTLWQPRPAGDPDWAGERFFHSKNTKQMLRDLVIAAGCHLCTQVSQEHNFSRAGDDQRVMVECSRSRAFEADEGNIPIVLFSAISCAEWDDNWASLPDPFKDEEPQPQGDSDMTPLAKFKLERTDDGSMFVLPSSTNSPEAFGLVRHWLDDCLNNHPECKGSNFKRLPTRLVDVGAPDNNAQKKPPRPRIFIPNATSQTPATIPYLTLSHSWALTGSSLRLTTKNIEDWQKPEGAEHGGIPIDGLAQTFLDAMRITQQLGYRYIWIDSLCIMQDSSEDWKREAQTMAAVYGNSLLTIFASGMGMAGGQGANADTCFSVRNPLKVYSPIITSPLSGRASFYAIREKYEPNVDEMLWGANQKNPLLSRGWIVQERLLSPRIIYYGADELYWECRLHAVSESCPFGTGLKKDAEASQSIWTANAKAVYQDLQDPFPASLKTGMDMGNDKEDAKYAQHLQLIALAGMVTAIEESKGWTYTLGSWQELWPFDLLWGFDSVLNVELFNPGWYPDDSEKRRQDRDEMARKLLKGQSYPESHASTTLGLPSWSWAATEAPKSFWFGSSGSLTWKCQIDVFGRTTTGMQESGILALKTYKKQLYDMPPIDLGLMWDDDESFYSKDEEVLAGRVYLDR